jgi:predicted membrane protein
MPFPAALLGAKSSADDHFVVVFYAASLTIASASLTAMWVYAVRRGLVDDSLDDSQVAGFTLLAVMTSAIFLLSIGAAFLGLLAAVTVWVALPPFARLLAGRRYPTSIAGVSEHR